MIPDALPPDPLKKAPPPGLSMRAPRPPAARLRKSVVQLVVLGGVTLVSGSLAWAFVIQPDLRDSARSRAAEAREAPSRSGVTPAEAVSGQPATYDRLPRLPDPDVARGPDTARLERPPGPETRRRPSNTDRPARAPGAQALAAQSSLFFEGLSASTHAPGPVVTDARPPDRPAMYNSHALTAPVSPYELKAGTVVPAVLLTAVDTERSGPVVAAVTQNLFDTVSGRHLVLPQGARLIGRHEGDSAYGDRRAFLVWDRLILPNGNSLLLSEEPGVDAQGAVGVRGQVDRRLAPLLIGTVFAGAITALGQIARDSDGRGGGGWLGDAGDAAAIQGAQAGGRLVDRELAVRPSIRLRPGAPVRVMITRDLVLEPYQP